MSRMTTVGRRGIVAVFAATVITTAACGTDTGTDTGTDKGTDVGNSVPYAPGAVAPVVPHAPSSADSAERRGATQEQTPPNTGTSADAAERRGQIPPAPPGMRIPD